MREKRIKVCWFREMENIVLIFDFLVLVFKRFGNILFLFLEVCEDIFSNFIINLFY